MKSNTKYAYSVARVRAMERRLLDRTRIESMLEAKSAPDVLKILAEGDYGAAMAEVKDGYQYETILLNERKRVFELLQKIAPQQEIIHLFAVKYDIHNLKVLLKAKYLGEDASDLLVDAGTINPAALAKMVAEENYRDLPAYYRRAVEEITAKFGLGGDPQTISFILDRAMYVMLMDLAKRYDSEYLQGYYRKQIDLLNIGTFLRVKNLKKSRDFLEDVLLDNGAVDRKTFLQLYNEPEPAEALISRLANTDYAPVVEEGARHWAKNHSTTFFEKLADNYLLEYMKKAKLVVFGVEPLLAYLFAKEVEIRIIRMIMVGKLNGIPVEEIRERLREAYA